MNKIDNPPFDLGLDDKVVIVTGGSRGLGRAMALGFARAGARVVVASRKIDACRSVCEEIRELGGRPALPVACHVGSWLDCGHLIDTTVQHHGRIDVLVNNAGMSPHYGELSNLSEELFDKVIGVNLRGPLRLSIKSAEVMRAQGTGSILNISSTSAVQPEPYDLPYAMAKAGLNTMTIGLSKALGPEVRVNAIMAGPFQTDVSASWNRDTFRRIREMAAAGRVGQPEEIVGAALYFTGDAARFTTGAVLKIDGGMAWSPS
jgi:NAD(P)-dependent dehydrogenase (short-subunit alcohol dehydrogenase family)